MLQINVSNVAEAIVEHELFPRSSTTTALHLNFDLRISYHIGNRSYDSRRGLHLLYYVPPQMSYVSLFSGVTASPLSKLHQVERWRHEITHDSEWRRANIFSQTYFGMAEEINAALVKDNKPPVAPRDMHEWHSFGRSGLFQWVPVKVTKDPQDENSYRRIIQLEEKS